MSEATPEATTTTPATTEPAPAETKSFTQDDVNAMLAKQKREQFGDYGDLKTKAQRLEEIEEQQKTEQQRHADVAAKAQRDADEARAESLRYKAAATYKVDPDYFDLLGTGDEETISGRAERVGTLLRENADMKVELDALRQGRPAPVQARPTTALKPGATPEQFQTEDDATYARLFGADAR